MTYHLVKGAHVFSCDGCSETFEGEPDDRFIDTLEAAKGEGWVAFQAGKEWKHRCPACGEEE